MNKQSLIASIAELSGLPKEKSTLALEEILEFIKNRLKEGNEVKISGFGTFRVFQREEVIGRNPKTGEPLKISATKLPRFRVPKALMEAIK